MPHPTLSEPVLLILATLAQAPRHGYAIMQDVESDTGGRVILRTATLYTALRRLVDGGFVEELPDADADPRRRTYGITARGRRLLSEEAARLRALLDLVDRRIPDGSPS